VPEQEKEWPIPNRSMEKCSRKNSRRVPVLR